MKEARPARSGAPTPPRSSSAMAAAPRARRSHDRRLDGRGRWRGGARPVGRARAAGPPQPPSRRPRRSRRRCRSAGARRAPRCSRRPHRRTASRRSPRRPGTGGGRRAPGRPRAPWPPWCARSGGCSPDTAGPATRAGVRITFFSSSVVITAPMTDVNHGEGEPPAVPQHADERRAPTAPRASEPTLMVWRMRAAACGGSGRRRRRDPAAPPGRRSDPNGSARTGGRRRRRRGCTSRAAPPARPSPGRRRAGAPARGRRPTAAGTARRSVEQYVVVEQDRATNCFTRLIVTAVPHGRTTR